jgi:DNA-binding transcriptional ArsR family regulator
MPTPNFDIYEVDGAYLAVTNEVRRRILDALAEEDKQLPDLVELTGKAKATLSSIHLKELVEQGLVEGRPHPDDSRKKLFRLTATKIGSSNVPLEELREAVKEYVSVAPQAARFPLPVTFDALAAAPEDVDAGGLSAQARRLGLLVGGVLEGPGDRDRLLAFADLVEQEDLAEPVRLDLDNGDALVLERGEAAPREAPIERVAALVAGFLEGILEADGAETASVRVDAAQGDEFRLVLDGD